MNIAEKLDEYHGQIVTKTIEENIPSYYVPTGITNVVKRVTNGYVQQEVMMAQQNCNTLVDRLVMGSDSFHIKDGELFEDKTRLCNFYMELRKSYLRYEFEDGEAQSFDVRVVMSRRGKEQEYFFDIVPLTDLHNTKFMKRLPFRVIYVDDFKPRWTRYINSLVEAFDGEEEIVFSSPGWKRFGRNWYYVDGQSVIGNKQIKARAISNRIIRKSNVKQPWVEIFAQMQNVLPGAQDKMTVLLLYVFGSFLYKLFDEVGKTLKFSLVLVGPRGSRKTSLALCFSQIEKKSSPTLNFQATVAGIQYKLKEYRDAVMLLDDLAPTHSNQRKHAYEEKLETLIRLFGDATERVICTAFMTNTSNKPDYSVGGGCIITGEYFYEAAVESSIARTVVLELESDMVDLKLLDYFQKNPLILESFLYDFLTFVSKNTNMIFEKMITISDYYREKTQGEYSNGRLSEYHGQLVAIGSMLADFFSLQVNYNMDDFINIVEMNVGKILSENDREMRRNAPIYKLLRAICFLLNTNYHYQWGQNVKFDSLFVIEDDSYYYLEASQLPAIMDHYCKKNAIGMVSLSTQQVTKMLEHAGIISSYDEGGRVRYAKKYSEYNGKRLLQLSKKVIEDCLS